MGKVRVVTDSSARFEHKRFTEAYNITVLPMRVRIGSNEYKDGIDIAAEDVLQRMRHARNEATILPPTVDDFSHVFTELTKTTDQICVVVHSRNFSETYNNAETARSQFLGRCDIAVIDSKISSAGLGYLVEEVALAADTGTNVEDMVHLVRGLIPRIYAVYYVETLEHIQKTGLIGETQAVVGDMLDIKPILTIEEGNLIAMEKARTHIQAIDKMIEFVAEFTSIEKLCILQNTSRITEHTRALQDRLALEFTQLNYPIMIYEPLMASLIGPTGMGIAVLEGDD